MNAQRGAEWLSRQQHSNGAFENPDQAAEETASIVVAVVAGGGEQPVIEKALGYLAANGRAASVRGAYTGRIVAAIVAGGGDPSDHGGFDFVAKLRSQQRPDGAYDDKFFGHLEAVNGLLAAKAAVPSGALASIRDSECSGGGFGDDYGCPNGANVDSTALAVDALIAAKERDAVVTRARSYLLSAQHADGGFGFTEATSSDSTGLALSAIASLKEDAQATPWRQNDDDDPVSALLQLQTKSGAFRFVATGKANVRSTSNAVPGLAGVAYPVPRRAVAAATPKPARSPKPSAPGDSAGAGPIAPPGSPVPGLVAGNGEGAPPTSAATTPMPSASALSHPAPFGGASEESADESDGLPRAVAATLLGAGIVGAGYGGFRWRRSIRR